VRADSSADGTLGSQDAGDQGPAQDTVAPIVCKADHDGTITAGESPLGAGLQAIFQVGLDVPVDPAGLEQPDGTTLWDVSVITPADKAVVAQTTPLEGTWYAEVFPGADYAGRLSERETLLGVFEVTAEALLLRGVVSPEDGVFRTELVYEPPVAVLTFPIQADSQWTTKASVSGLGVGVPVFYDESYVSTVDGAGAIVTPFGELPVLRINVLMERTIGLMTTKVRTYLFVAECFGAVASMVSHDNDSAQDFEQAAELRRLGK